MNRSEQRVAAFEMIFAFPFNENRADDIIETYMESNELASLPAYVTDTVKGTAEHLEEIDGRIKASIQTRKFERLDRVCLAVMRLAVYEIFYNEDVPTAVAVNEAIEITKKYDDTLTAFVHGNLGIISKAHNE